MSYEVVSREIFSSLLGNLSVSNKRNRHQPRYRFIRHVALPGVATWLYLMMPYGLIRCRHMALPGLAMCHHYNPYPCMAAMCHTHGSS